MTKDISKISNIDPIVTIGYKFKLRLIFKVMTVVAKPLEVVEEIKVPFLILSYLTQEYSKNIF